MCVKNAAFFPSLLPQKKRFYPLFFTPNPLKKKREQNAIREERNDDDDDDNTEDDDEAKSDV